MEEEQTGPLDHVTSVSGGDSCLPHTVHSHSGQNLRVSLSGAQDGIAGGKPSPR